MKIYQKANNIIGWFVFLIAAIVYIVTLEPTASFWDCGEYIATAAGLQVGHPPGAPTFQILGRFFSLFASDSSQIAYMINLISALASAFTVLFLFWSITTIAKKIVTMGKELTQANMIAVIGSGLVGAFAYAFSDSFWFSAVEGEVYATSSFFTAIVFWAILKWESVADEKYAVRWLILIAYLVGLSIGVHLLNLLAIPAIVFVVYFKKYKPNRKGMIVAGLVSLFVLSGVMYGIIPLIVDIFAKTELFFVNSIGLPFNSGTIFFAIVLTGIIIFGLRYTITLNRNTGILAAVFGITFFILALIGNSSVGNFFIRLLVGGVLIYLVYRVRTKISLLKTILLSFTFLLIGYSSFFLLVIRSNANPPIDENNPENAISLLAYLNREQYGDWPISKGAYFNAPTNQVKEWKDGNPVYTMDEESGKYIITDDRKLSIPTYNKDYITIFPRMWSTQGKHVGDYLQWGGIEESSIYNYRTDENGDIVKDRNGRKVRGAAKAPPSFSENISFFFNYQIKHMYLRYFAWNFIGKQNDLQGHGGFQHGNWISGITVIDEMMVGPQENLPNNIAANKANNKFYFLPFILGLVGFIFLMRANYKDGIVVSLLFVFTGFAIVIFLNQYSPQPRERDYAYAASFYAYAIWIGIGVLGLYKTIVNQLKANRLYTAIGVTIVCLILVPGIMANEGWDDHDRSNRYTALSTAKNYLNSCAPNAILFTNGDNDTFPLWYAQEVEGIRQDVRVVNLSLLNTDWYIDQMSRKAYTSDRLPFSLTKDKYRQGTRDYVLLMDNPNLAGKYTLKELMDFVASDDLKTKRKPDNNRPPFDFFPTRDFSIPVDSAKVINNGTVPKKFAGDIVKSIDWKLNKYGVQKNHLMVLDLLAHFDWNRPIYFALTTGKESYVGLTDYFQVEGLAYRLVPFKKKSRDGQVGWINTDIMYNNVMNKFEWGNIGDPKVYLDETNMRMTTNFRNNFARLSTALMLEGKKDSAVKVCDKCIEVMPDEAIPFDYFVITMARVYYGCDEMGKGNKIANRLIDIYENNLKYYFNLPTKFGDKVNQDIAFGLQAIGQIEELTRKHGQIELNAKALDICKLYAEQFYKFGISDRYARMAQEMMEQPVIETSEGNAPPADAKKDTLVVE